MLFHNPCPAVRHAARIYLAADTGAGEMRPHPLRDPLRDGLIGSQGDDRISIEEVVNRIPTIPHEILCDINRRVPRVYLKDGEIVKVTQYLFD